MKMFYRNYHAVVLSNSSATSEKCNEKDDGTDGNKKRRHREEPAIEEMVISAEDSENDASYQDQNDSGDLLTKISISEADKQKYTF